MGLALDLEDYHPPVLLHCWLGHLTCKIVSEITYNVSSGTLNPTIPVHGNLSRSLSLTDCSGDWHCTLLLLQAGSDGWWFLLHVCCLWMFAADFFQLLFVCLQWRAFHLESSARKREAEDPGKIFDGGSNASILKKIESDDCQNPYDDFISYKK